MRKPFFQTNFAKFFAAIAALVLLNARPEIMAQDTEMTRSTLKGLPGVYVLVEDFTEQNKAASFDERIFQTDVELKLRLAGIKVLTMKEGVATPGDLTSISMSMHCINNRDRITLTIFP